jgi:hypothetical protein
MTLFDSLGAFSVVRVTVMAAVLRVDDVSSNLCFNKARSTSKVGCSSTRAFRIETLAESYYTNCLELLLFIFNLRNKTLSVF